MKFEIGQEVETTVDNAADTGLVEGTKGIVTNLYEEDQVVELDVNGETVYVMEDEIE